MSCFTEKETEADSGDNSLHFFARDTSESTIWLTEFTKSRNHHQRRKQLQSQVPPCCSCPFWCQTRTRRNTLVLLFWGGGFLWRALSAYRVTIDNPEVGQLCIRVCVLSVGSGMLGGSVFPLPTHNSNNKIKTCLQKKWLNSSRISDWRDRYNLLYFFLHSPKSCIFVSWLFQHILKGGGEMSQQEITFITKNNEISIQYWEKFFFQREKHKKKKKKKTIQ